MYNLIGTRDDLVYALVSRVLSELGDSLDALDPSDPIAAAQLIADHTVAMRQARAMGILRDDIDAAGLARQVFLSYIGAITRWSAGRLDDNGFLIAARNGLFTALAAAANDDHRPQFVARLRALGKELETDAWHRTRH